MSWLSLLLIAAASAAGAAIGTAVTAALFVVFCIGAD